MLGVGAFGLTGAGGVIRFRSKVTIKKHHISMACLILVYYVTAVFRNVDATRANKKKVHDIWLLQ